MVQRVKPRQVCRHVGISLAIACTCGAVVLFGSDLSYSKNDADNFRRKIVLINQNSLVPSKTLRLTRVSEGEVNAFLRFYAGDQIPTGVVEPAVFILGDGRVAGRATVDLDQVRRERGSGGWLDPVSYLRGRLPVSASGVLRTEAGVGRFELESAEVSGITVPKLVLQELVTYYSRTPDHPNGINLDDPFELPAGIREIRVDKRQAVVVQ